MLEHLCNTASAGKQISYSSPINRTKCLHDCVIYKIKYFGFGTYVSHSYLLQSRFFSLNYEYYSKNSSSISNDYSANIHITFAGKWMMP